MTELGSSAARTAAATDEDGGNEATKGRVQSLRNYPDRVLVSTELFEIGGDDFACHHRLRPGPGQLGVAYRQRVTQHCQRPRPVSLRLHHTQQCKGETEQTAAFPFSIWGGRRSCGIRQQTGLQSASCAAMRNEIGAELRSTRQPECRGAQTVFGADRRSGRGQRLPPGAIVLGVGRGFLRQSRWHRSQTICDLVAGAGGRPASAGSRSQYLSVATGCAVGTGRPVHGAAVTDTDFGRC